MPPPPALSENGIILPFSEMGLKAGVSSAQEHTGASPSYKPVSAVSTLAPTQLTRDLASALHAYH